MPAVPWMHVGRAVGGGCDGDLQPRQTADCERRRTQQARQRAGARRYVRCFPGFESPCSSAREHPGKSSARFDVPVDCARFHASRAHVHPRHVAVCVPLCRLRAHLRPYPYPTTARPLRVHRSVSGVWACVAAVRVVMASRLWFRPLVCVGGRSRRCFHRRRQNVRRSTDANAGLCSAHGTTQRDHHGGWGDLHGGAFRSFGVCIAATGRPRSVCSATRENEDGGSDGICAAPQSPQTHKRSLQTV